MSAFPSADMGQRNEVEAAKPMQRAYSSSVLRSEVRWMSFLADSNQASTLFPVQGMFTATERGMGMAPARSARGVPVPLPCLFITSVN